MQKKYLIGNWKMYKTVEEATAFMRALLPQLEAIDTNGLALYIAPAFPHLSAMAKCISGHSSMQLLAQNCHHEVEGAFTGEVSAAMLAAMDVKGVLIGHSERRIYQKEDHFVLAKKIKRVLAAGMQPFFCCGENLAERKKGNYKSVVQQQLLASLQGITPEDATKLTIAYEPVWAIGTGEVASLEVITEMHTFIREVLWEAFSHEKIHILYGGSCNPQNAKAIFDAAHVAGGLIGGASLEASRFMELVKLLVAQKDDNSY